MEIKSSFWRLLFLFQGSQTLSPPPTSSLSSLSKRSFSLEALADLYKWPPQAGDVDLLSWSPCPTCSHAHMTTCRHSNLVPSQRGPQPLTFDLGCRPEKHSQPCPLLIPTTALGGRQGSQASLWGNLAVQKLSPRA